MTTDTYVPSNAVTPRWLALIALVLILGGGWILYSRTPQTASVVDLPPLPVKGHPAPEISLVSTAGQPMALSDFQGQPVVINFWATWCAPCRAETPELQDIHRELGDQVVIFSVNMTQQDNGDVPAFIEEFGVTFPVVLDTEGVAETDYQIRGLPTTVFVDTAGVIQEVFTGPVNKAYIESKLPDLL